MKEAFMPHSDRYPNLSRDWEEFDCKSQCAWQKDGHCTVPSLAKIGEDGRCEGYRPLYTLKPKDEHTI